MGRRDRYSIHKPRPPRPEMPKGKAQGEPDTRLERIRAAMAAEDWPEALRIASHIASLGEDESAIRRGWEACARPDFQRQLGRDPADLIEDGKAALRRRFGT